MKWTNKGHEFDEVYKNIIKHDEFYLFGAGDYGQIFYNVIAGEIKINAYIDNNEQKQGTLYNDKPVISFSDIDRTTNHAIIITASQIARIGIITQLENAVYSKNENIFMIEDFLSIYNVYKYNKVYFSSISMLPSTLCNLNCECCLNFNPFAKKPDIRPIEQVKEDVDIFFKCVEFVGLFHFSGGEPFLYPHALDVVKHICSYKEKIGLFRMITNGTVVPKEELVKELSKYDFELTIDDYRKAVPKYNDNFDKLLELLEKYNIRYTINKADSWIDLAPTKTDNNHFSEEELQKHFEDCGQSWQELREGKLYTCNYDGYATVAGINPEQDEEIYKLTEFTSDKKKELVEFRLGFNGKGYTNLCKHCRGFCADNDVAMEPAKQLER